MPSRCAHLIALLLVTLGAWTPRVAFGQQRAAAELLFEEGRKAMDAKQYDQACAKFEESNRLDRASGTTLNLANCEERRGRVASAWERYRAALELLAEGDRRREFTQNKVNALKPRVPHLTIDLSDDAPSNTTVRRNDKPLTGSFGISLPLDPGQYTITAVAPGREPQDYEITLEEGEDKSLTVEPGDVIEEEPERPNTGSVGPTIVRDEGETQRTLAYVFGGLGLASLATGGVFGVLAYKNQKTIDQYCEGTTCYDPAGPSAGKAGVRNALLANVLVPLGVASLGVGLYFLVSAPEAPEAVLEAGVFQDVTGMRIRGSF